MRNFLANNKLTLLGFLVLIIVSSFLRLSGLGFSNYYGDETKTLYVNKTIPAFTFLLDQRKGPVQFLAAWFMEKLSGSYSEFWIRLPFALAGIISIIFFALVVYELFKNPKISFYATFVYSVSGFNIAFSRTAQYQTFVMLFGLVGLWLFLRYISSQKILFAILAGVFYGLGLLSHYDAVFYLIPVFVSLISKDSFDKNKKGTFLLVFITFLVAGFFYVPYIIKGYFVSNTVGYLSRRLTGGNDYLPNNSIKTFLAYNPFILYFALLVVSFIGFIFLNFKQGIKNISLPIWRVVLWFLIPFILFQFIFANPGTHILNYFVPLYIMTGYFIYEFISTKSYIWKQSKVVSLLFYVVLVLQIVFSAFVYVPNLNTGYPWKNSSILGISIKPISRDTNLFLYGFPYNRGWNEIARYINQQNRVRGFYTNDNTVLAKYYLPKYPLTIPGSNFYPQYYIEVPYSQEFTSASAEFLSHYKLQQEIAIANSPAVKVYIIK